MAENNVGLHPQQAKGERDNNVVPMDPAIEERGAQKELVADRYHLNAPTFTGEEEVEQFIREFGDVMEVTQWPPQGSLAEAENAIDE